MDVYSGESLKHLCLKATYNLPHKRFCFDDVKNYLYGETDRKTLCLYGLRRTGKTILMYQSALELNDFENTGYIIVEKNAEEHINDLRKILNEHIDCKYFFIDEITYLENFIDASTPLANIYTMQGKKIVMTGTNSLGFKFAKADSLYDRMHLIPTTYISYKEYCHIFPDKNIDEYIEYGGTLTDGKTFYNDVISEEYTNTAIVENIQHSLEHFDNGLKWGRLLKIYDNDELTTYITKTLESFQYDFLMKIINNPFKFFVLGSARNLADKRDELFFDAKKLKSEQILNSVREAIKVKIELAERADEKALSQIKSYLAQMNVILTAPNSPDERTYFIQPGMRYAIISAILETIKQSPELKDYSRNTINEIYKIIDHDAKGRIMEDVIRCDLWLNKTIRNKYDIERFNDNRYETSTNGEIDIVLINKENNSLILLEVKHSSQFVENQIKWLNNDNLCKAAQIEYGGIIIGKALIYQGENKSVNYGVSVVNAQDFLCYTNKWLYEIKKIRYKLFVATHLKWHGNMAKQGFYKIVYGDACRHKHRRQRQLYGISIS